MATSAGASTLRKPLAWLAGLARLGLVLGCSTALYVVRPAMKLPLPWWAAVVAPVLVYALVLPLCVPRIRMRGWLTGFFALATLHLGIALATAWLYSRVDFISFEEALPTALWGFPPALVLTMAGSLVMALPFLGAFTPLAAAQRRQAVVAPPRAGVMKQPRPVPEITPSRDRQAWARVSAGAERESAVSAAVAQVASALPAMAVDAPTRAEPPVVVPSVPAAPAAPQMRANGGAPPTAQAKESAAADDDLPPANVPGFRQALSELFGPPSTASVVDETLEAPGEPAASEPSLSPGVAAGAPATLEAVVRIPFDRVVAQLPPGAFRVPLGQIGARLREVETLVVPQELVLPQLGEGMVQVAWEAVAEQFPVAVFAVAPAEVKERIVNGRLLLPLDEIVRQLPPDLFAVSTGRGPVQVPGIESFPEPFKPLDWEGPPPDAADAEPGSPTTRPPSASVHAVTESQRVSHEAPVQARTIERGAFTERQTAHQQFRCDADRLASLLAPWETWALEEAQVGDFAILSVSATGLAGSAVAAAAGRLSPLIARRAPRPVEQATLRGVGGTLVLTPVGSGWNTGRAVAVGLRPGGPVACLEMLARRAAAAQDPGPPAAEPRTVTPEPMFDHAPPPPVATAPEDLDAFGPLTAQSYREPMSGALIHYFAPPGASAAELAPFAWELAQAMAPGPEAGALGSFHSAVLRSGRERVEIRRLSSATGPAHVLVVAGADTGRPGLARLQVERAAARLSGA